MAPTSPGSSDGPLADRPAPCSSRLKTNPLIRVLDEVVRIQSRFASLFEDLREMSGLNRMENTVLTAVLEASAPPTVPQIGRSLGHPRQVIQRAVDALVSRGLVEKRPNPDHKRVPLLVGTATAYESKKVTDGLAREIAEQFFRDFDRETCRRIGDDLHQLREAMEAFARRRNKHKA